jgi:lysylphosphatidylglycerol synthetase-like protein (DUF2156 family)
MSVISGRRAFDALMDRRLPSVELAPLSMKRRLALVGQHGDFSLAYSTAVQPALSYFGDCNGYIAFATKMGFVFALGDPVAPAHLRADYLRRFIAAAGTPIFVQTGPETARQLSSMGYRVNQLGIETTFDLGTHSFAGKPMETVRYSERWLLKQGYSIAETALDDRAAVELSKAWIASRIVRRREMRFLNRPFSPELHLGMRRFVLSDRDGRAVALLDFDPICRNGETIGYSTAFKRKLPKTTAHAEIGMTKFAVDRFRQEGRKVVTLGLSPLAGIETSGFRESVPLRVALGRAFASPSVNRMIFNLEGQAAFKRRFHADPVPTYLAMKSNSLAGMFALLRLCKVF